MLYPLNLIVNQGLKSFPELGDGLAGGRKHDGDELAQVEDIVPVRVSQLVDGLHLLSVELVACGPGSTTVIIHCILQQHMTCFE